jgi:hypothetical protein
MRRALPSPLPTLLVVVAVAPALPACSDFASPSALPKPTVLAVIADPPLVAPGGTTALTVVVAGPDGVVTPDAITWSLRETFPGVPPFGAVDGDADGAVFTAPDPVPALPENVPPVVSVQATIEVDGEVLVPAVKAVVVADAPSANPEITALRVDGEPVDEALTLAAGAAYPLEVALEPAPGEDATWAWYTTAGEISQFQSNPCELVAAEEPGTGHLFVVARDGRGGTAWRGVSVTVE